MQACSLSVEVLGGSTRVPAVFKLIENVFGCVPSRTLNAKEVVCRGAALQCAMISPLIKVRQRDGEGGGATPGLGRASSDDASSGAIWLFSE